MNELSYEQAIARLENIVEQIENGVIEVDQLPKVLKETQDLSTYCRQKLFAAEEEIKKMTDIIDAKECEK